MALIQHISRSHPLHPRQSSHDRLGNGQMECR
jgi:hypothetical protein